MQHESVADPTQTLSRTHSDEALPSGLKSGGFIGMVVAQALGAFNDNMFRWLVVGIGHYKSAPGNEALVLSVGLACLVAPFLLLAPIAGYCADRFSKKKVIVGTKIAELCIMLLGGIVIWRGEALSTAFAIPQLDLYALFTILFLMGSQSAIFSPSKFGSIPELVHSSKISAANGIVGLSTMIAIILGTMAGTNLYDFVEPPAPMPSFANEAAFGENLNPVAPRKLPLRNLWAPVVALGSVSLAGVTASLMIGPLRSANPNRTFPIRMASQLIRDLSRLASNSALLRVALGSAFFWTLASLAQMNVERFHAEIFESRLFIANEYDLGKLLASLSLGVGLGSVLAGIWSGGRVELGIVPLAACGIVVFSGAMALVSDPVSSATGTYMVSLLGLLLLGVSAGLFDIPLEAYLQHRSDPTVRGSILAATNFLVFTGMLLAAGLFWVLMTIGQLSARQIFLVSAALTVPVAIYAFMLLPQATIRFIIWIGTRTLYRVKVHNLQSLPETGGALLVANHVSWMDGCLLLVTSSRRIRMMIYQPLTEFWWARWLVRTMGVIPIKPTPKSTRRAIETARQALENGELVCVFPEGGISRTGQMMPFKPGFMSMVKGTGAPVIPIYLAGLWGSIFSFERGRFFWKLPRKWRYLVSIFFGPPIAEPEDIYQVRGAIMNLEVQAMERHERRDTNLPSMFLKQCRKSRRRPKVSDSSGAEMTGGSLLMRTLIMRRLLRRRLGENERFVGLLVPPSAGGVIANAALTVDRRVPVNLNYTVSNNVLNECIRRCDIKHVLTSRRFLERMPLQVDCEVIFLEDLIKEVTLADKAISAAAAFAMPLKVLTRSLGIHKIRSDDLLTVIFTSGSTGTPKGVMLTHGNVASNVEAISQIIRLTADDVLIGVLPFFHSYGFTATMWTVLALDPKGVYHYSPLDAQQVGNLSHKHRATVFMSTPTFLRRYLRRCSKEQFSALEVVFASAERLPRELSDAFEEQFGIRPSEAYGATELSPLVAVNIPAARSPSSQSLTSREGTVGRPIPGVVAKILDPESGDEIGVGKPGMLWIKGPNVMQGYYEQPDETAKVIHDGWYKTGDLALIDEDGFIRITGRESRFSKIGGEMVPHIKIEEALVEIIGGSDENVAVAVTAVPDTKKGERLVVVHTQIDRTPAELCEQLVERGLPNLWIPSRDSFVKVDEIPVLGSGKLDLKALKELAESSFSETATDQPK